ncbi:hypothetical protein I3U41_12175 [Mycobacteroides abscessus subsp. abscessus]|uniref:hypothetical protein n=1 Tax=Mycobacteroides abscessus TaxID=36809 RepID=UPI0019CFE858|nr:hypothetical protein [Mycobacteroides abscessus]QSN23231.1 hypothetical protein I3U41_12175 [Mycobacteroides abscessus subsp. abscessus]
MQYPSKFAALALAAAVAVTLTACAADPEPAHQSSRQASGIVALPAPTPPNETGVDAARYEAG